MGNPRNPDNDRVNVSLRLPPDLVEQLDYECDQRLLGRSKLMEHLLRAGLERLPSVPDPQLEQS